jgi:hypothetical protein
MEDIVDRINLCSGIGGERYQLWVAREHAERQAAGLSRVRDIEYEASAMPGDSDLWYIRPRGTNEGALGANGGALPPSLFLRMTRMAQYVALAQTYTNDQDPTFEKHCVAWLREDPLGLASLGVPDDEYSSWAAATTYLTRKNGLADGELAQAIRQLYADEGAPIDVGRAAELAQQFHQLSVWVKD